MGDQLRSPHQVDILPASKDQQETIENLWRFYAYDMSEFMGPIQKGWEFPETGLYENIDVSRYWEEPDRYPFLIRVIEELAGFLLINKVGATPDVDWHMAEFFIVRKFKRQGVGTKAAKWCFDNFPGVWEITQMPGNTPAIAFWKKVVTINSKGNFEESVKEILDPVPHPMIVLKFSTLRGS